MIKTGERFNHFYQEHFTAFRNASVGLGIILFTGVTLRIVSDHTVTNSGNPNEHQTPTPTLTEPTIIASPTLEPMLGGVAPQEAAPPAEMYIVQRGDSLLLIAQKLSVPLDQLVNINGIRDPDYIYEGQVLLIPPPLVPTTQPVEVQPVPPAPATQALIPPTPVNPETLYMTEYKVPPQGSTVGEVATLFGISEYMLISNNANIRGLIIPGGELLVIMGPLAMREPTFSHILMEEDCTLLEAAQKFGVQPRDLFAANTWLRSADPSLPIGMGTTLRYPNINPS